ncbi:EAL domain-containing protein [Acetobacterium sp.]|uniref:EAL domain-containing protein n=1 Tax=Acetobacterium sp. TaxID=1872094 RepID=UPI00272448EC|nr:EAL domain-containing protein [Acetobacterium sp.]MDO9494053.1 EAL domain-containing protein [Acetobacterium sp.]
MTLQNIISMTFYLTFVVYVIFGTYSLTVNIKSRLNRVFACLCFCFALWGFTFAAINSSLTSEEALLWRRMSVLGWGVVYSIMLHFSIVLMESSWSQKQKKTLLTSLLYLPAVINVIVFFIYSMPENGHVQMIYSPAGWITTTDVIWYDRMFLGYYLSFSLASMIVIVQWYRQTDSAINRKKALAILSSFLVALVLGTLTDIITVSYSNVQLPSLAPLIIMIPVVTIYCIIRKYGLMLSPQNINESQPEGIILSTLSRTRLLKYVSIVMIVGSILNFYDRIRAGENSITGLLLSFTLVLMGAVVVGIPYLFKSIKVQETVLGLFLGILMPVVMLAYFNTDFINIIWPVPIFFMMITVIFNNKNIFLVLGALSLLMEVILWILMPDLWLMVDQKFYFYRLLFYIIGIGMTAIITQIYVLRLQENSKQDAFQKMISQLSSDFVTMNRTNFDEKINQLLKKSGNFTRTDRVYIGRFSQDGKKLFFTHEWLKEGITPLIGDTENNVATTLAWSIGQLLNNDIVYIPSANQLPVTADEERQWLKKQKVRSQILVPIQSNHSIIGLIGFDEMHGSKALRVIDQDWLRVLANLLADAIAKVETEHDMNYLAYYDPLTGIPNRVLFYRRLEQAIDLARETGKNLGVIFIDLDGFKEVNDTLGHDWGDQLLSRIGKRLTDCLGEADLVGRFGGDEFLIMVPQISHHLELEKMAGQVMSIFHRPMLVAEQELYISGSGGIAVYPKDGENVNSLIKNADLAMYAAKKSGKGRISYCSGVMKEAVQEKMTLTNSLHRALEEQELFLHYQPQVSAITHEISGFEALLRWQHPERGVISPEVFIPLAEQSGLISSIGEWVLKTACAQNKIWQDQGYKPVRMGVNLSVEQFRSSNLERIIRNCLDATGLEPQYLELEITEGIAMKTSQYVVRQLEALKKLGVTISIDDFGTAFSSLRRLKDLPVDRLKIDKQFIWGIGENPRDEAVISVMIHLARELGLEVTAEGVETAAQLAFLKVEACDEIQGFYFSKPVSAAAIKEDIYQNQFSRIKNNSRCVEALAGGVLS